MNGATETNLSNNEASFIISTNDSTPATDVRDRHPDPTTHTVWRTRLYPTRPNPFNPTTVVSFEISKRGHVEIRIYDIAGRLVRTLLNEEKEPGRYEVIWDGKNQRSRPVPSGIYFCQLIAPDHVASTKMVLLR